MFQVYQANNFKEVIELVRNARRKHGAVAGKTHSYQYLANKLGYRSPRSLAMVHKGQRLPSRELVRKLIEHLDLTKIESELVLLLAEKAICESKNTDCADLNERIARVRRTAQQLSESETTNNSNSKFIYLSFSELEEVRLKMKLLTIEIKCQYENFSPEKTRYRFNLELFKV